MVHISESRNNSYKIEKLIEELTEIVQDEINAYTLLLDILVEQQSAILTGDTEIITHSDADLKRYFDHAKEIGQERESTSEKFSDLIQNHDNMELEDIIPLIEKKYSQRLNEFKNILEILSDKVNNTNKRNQFLLNTSKEFIDTCIRKLADGHNI